MDKDFWIAVARNDFQIPEGYTLENLTEILFSYLNSTDPELRDDIAYIVYANWLKREMYSPEMLKFHVDMLLANLEKGICETESDTIFLRAFSILFLAELVHNDNKKPVLERDQVRTVLAKALWYLEAERDPRGYVPVKGWAHALAHTADLLLVLARNRTIEEEDLRKMLDAISTKIVHSGNTIYVYGEDERLASAIVEILRRDAVPLENVENWIKTFIQPEGNTWKGAYAEEERNYAFQNTRNLLRSLYLELLAQPPEFPHRQQLVTSLFDCLHALNPLS